jgi:hypothetical protein
MSTLTIRLPDDKHERLKALARSSSISINKLMDDLATVALANYDARVRFETRAARGNPKRALTLLATSWIVHTEVPLMHRSGGAGTFAGTANFGMA